MQCLGLWRYLRQELAEGSRQGWLVDFQQEDPQDNPVILQRHGTLLGVTTFFANEGYTLTGPNISTAFNAPFKLVMNDPYSKISNSRDLNPYFSNFASLPATVFGQARLLTDMSKSSGGTRRRQ